MVVKYYFRFLFAFITCCLVCACKNDNVHSIEASDNAAIQEIPSEKYIHRLNALRDSYLLDYGASHNLLHFSDFLNSHIENENEGSILQYLFVREILNNNPDWNDITEDPLIYFVKDIEMKYQAHYPNSIYKKQLILLLRDYFTSEQGIPAYPMEVHDTSGATIFLNDFTGRLIVLDFWATWCIPCLEQMPYLEKIKEEYAGKGVLFITVNMDDKEKKWLDFLRKKKPQYEISTRLPYGGEDPQATEVGVNALPVYQFIDKQGMYITRDGPKPSSAVFSAILDESI